MMWPSPKQVKDSSPELRSERRRIPLFFPNFPAKNGAAEASQGKKKIKRKIIYAAAAPAQAERLGSIGPSLSNGHCGNLAQGDFLKPVRKNIFSSSFLPFLNTFALLIFWSIRVSFLDRAPANTYLL